MNIDDFNDSTWFQCELEERRDRELLARDPGYLEWLDSIEHLRKDTTHEIPRESHC